MKRPRLMAVCLLLLAGCGTGEDVFFVRSGEADMPVWIRGDASSPWLVLLVHGGPGGTGEVYQETGTFQRLEQHFSVAYWDQRAAGSSQGNAATVESLTLDRYVSDLDAVVRVLKQRRPEQQVVLFGHSWGGTLTAAYLEDPERQARVARWVCLDGPSSLPENEGYSRAWVMAQAQARVDAGDDADHWRQVLAWYGDHPEITPALAYDHFENLVALGGLVRDQKVLDVHASNQLVYLSPFGGMATLSNQQATIDVMLAEADSPNALLRTDLNAGLGGITLPSLLAWGQYDGDVPMPMGQLLLQRIGTPAADKQLVVLDHSAHSGQYEDPEELSGAVVDFLGAPLQ
jgi:pimeloyl-ACP methyl ester carboxylesterase